MLIAVNLWQCSEIEEASGLPGLENQFGAVRGMEVSYRLPTSKVIVIHLALAGLFAWSPFIWQMGTIDLNPISARGSLQYGSH